MIRQGGTFWCFVLDLDDFKLVNDTLGHLAGDEVLKRIASILRSSVRNQDLVARVGGDEFALLCAVPRGEAEVAVVGPADPDQGGPAAGELERVAGNVHRHRQGPRRGGTPGRLLPRRRRPLPGEAGRQERLLYRYGGMTEKTAGFAPAPWFRRDHRET